jgi:hypothetical protein
MKKNQTLRIAAILLAMLPVAFSACIKDKCSRVETFVWYEPVYKTKAEVRANIRSNAPKELKNTGKFYMYANYIFLNEVDKGIHIIDNSNPSSPRKTGFIDIPGNLDIAVKGNTLYADMYTDLVTLDITNPSSVVVRKFTENIFPERAWGNGFIADPDLVIVDWKKVDSSFTTSCDENTMPWFDRGGAVFLGSTASGGGASSAGPIGVGGSMARFTIMNNYLYTVNDRALNTFNISNTSDPLQTSTVNVGWSIETIYPFKDKLFIGSRTGMFMYSVANPDAPSIIGQFQHIRSCDPVIADDNYAYVTLSSGTTCAGVVNELDILKLNNNANPQLLKVYNMTNPKGLSKSGDHLFICDGAAGLKVYNAADVLNLQLEKTITGIDAFDVITTSNNIALVVAKGGLYQYDYSNFSNIRLLSKITINQ